MSGWGHGCQEEGPNNANATETSHMLGTPVTVIKNWTIKKYRFYPYLHGSAQGIRVGVKMRAA